MEHYGKMNEMEAVMYRLQTVVLLVSYFILQFLIRLSLEQEVRIVSWDDDNEVELTYYNGSSWIELDNWNLDELQTGDWVGRHVGAITSKCF